MAAAMDRAGAAGLDYRHTTTDLLGYLSGSVGMLWSLLSTHYGRLFSSSITGTIPTTVAATGDNYNSIPFPNDISSIQSVEVLRNNQWQQLRRADFESARESFQLLGAHEPTHWTIGGFPQSAGATVTAGTIRTYPASNLGRTYMITYQRETPVFSDSSNPIYLTQTWLEWLVLDMAAKIHSKDEEHESAAGKIALAQIVWEQIGKELQQTERDRPPSPRKVVYR